MTKINEMKNIFNYKADSATFVMSHHEPFLLTVTDIIIVRTSIARYMTVAQKRTITKHQHPIHIEIQPWAYPVQTLS